LTGAARQSVVATCGRFWIRLNKVLFFSFFFAGLTLMLPALDRPFGGGQTWVLSTETYGATITFRGLNNQWALGNATICKARATPLRTAPDGAASDLCDPRRFHPAELGDVILDWPDQAMIELRQAGQRMELRLLSDTPDLPRSSLVFFASDTPDRQGALGFAGTLEIGNLMSTGARNYLVEGTYMVREMGFLASLFARRTNVVKTGVFTRGDVVSIVGSDSHDPATGFGHITQGATPQDPLHVVFLSSGRSGAVQINALGQDKPAFLKPDWLERALASPFLIMIAFFVSLVGGFGQVVAWLTHRS
jgi:hypothetical protein